MMSTEGSCCDHYTVESNEIMESAQCKINRPSGHHRDSGAESWIVGSDGDAVHRLASHGIDCVISIGIHHLVQILIDEVNSVITFGKGHNTCVNTIRVTESSIVI